ncbi:MAG TPA: LOG family protein, partial [Gemmatimonadaceae bacterium]
AGGRGAGVWRHGVIPKALVDRELAHTGLTELRVVNTMHERKAKMAATTHSSGFSTPPARKDSCAPASARSSRWSMTCRGRSTPSVRLCRHDERRNLSLGQIELKRHLYQLFDG